ncbi:MAG: hypothetical protein GY794_18380, partial [bacterium]|nr:hypothetical protein [bacterium]
DLTSRATNTEIEALSATINKNIQSGRTVALRNVEHARRRSGKPKGKDRSDGGEQEETKPDGVSDEDWRLSRLTDADVLHEAREGALKKLMYKKSHTGMVYVSPETLAMVADSRRPDRKKAPVELDVIFPGEIWSWKDAPATTLWEAQLNLWVSKDILSSIDATNQQSLRTAEGVRKANVPNAAIKSLEDIRITEKYLRARSTRGAANTKTKPDLTTRATTDEYEIVEYNFTVIMKSSYLPALMKNLMTRGEHTITNVSVVNVPDNPEGSQYFGTDPVNRVEIAGEVLFRAGWTRKIMPPETLDRRSANVPGTGTKEFPGQKNRDKNR